MKKHEFPLGWQVALSSLGQLATLCLHAGLEHVSLRRFGQDHIENLFCVIRGRNGFNDRPEYRPFQSALRSAALSNLLRPLTSAANCEADGDNMVTSVLLEKKKKVACATSQQMEVEALADGDIFAGDESTELTNVVNNIQLFASEMQAMSYIGGYIVQRLKWKNLIDCDQCVAALVSSVPSEFIKLKQFDYEDCAQLLTPSQQLLTFLRNAECIFRHHIKAIAYRAGVAATLKRRIIQKVSEIVVCEGHNVTACILTLFLRIRLHHWCKLTNLSIKTERDAKRKAKKVNKLT